MELNGRHAVVTGGGRGIGRACAAALTGAGATVTILGRDRASLDAAVASGVAAACFAADVTDEMVVRDALERAVSQSGPVDILVANAGGTETMPFKKTDAAHFRRMFELNVMGVVHCTRAVLDDMASRGFGRIVVIASTAALKGYAYGAGYCAAKHAVVGFVRSLAVETASKGITVNAICPAFTETDLLQDSLARIASKSGRSKDDVRADFERQLPIGRLIRPEEVGAAVCYLSSAGAAAITGTTLAISGGEV
jgi:NAD(P)-dependent dehydrogenase (short-subunit alcohol dehydrogenase family)